MDTSRHAGRLAIITGAASGIGRASFMRLAQEGAAVVGCDVDERGLDAACASVIVLGGSCEVISGDLRSGEPVELIVRRVIETHGRIDILANVAERQATFLASAERIAEPNEIASLISWLASDEASNFSAELGNRAVEP